MTIEFTTAFTKTPVVEFTYPVDDLQPLFDGYQSWSPNLDLKGLGYTGLDKRLVLLAGSFKNSASETFRLALDNSKRNLVEQFLKIDTEKRWPNIPQQISNQIFVYQSLTADLPGYKMDPHIDNRTVYAAGYLNVFDNDPVTIVSTHPPSGNEIHTGAEYHAPGAKGTGVIWLNTDNSWHWVNTVSRDRKIIMLSFQLVPWN